MGMPGFTAEATLGHSSEYFYKGAAADSASGLIPALVAPSRCWTSSCLTVGNCRTKVTCCQGIFGTCRCATKLCSIEDL